MKLDNEHQRVALLSLIASVTVPGNAIDDAYALKKAIEAAEIEYPATEQPPQGE